jgi:hypothetical protein
MTRDPLSSLLRVRRLALDEARQSLADCLAAEARAMHALAEAEAEIARERRTAASLDADDAAVEVFAGWLRVARGRSAQAEAAHERVTAETTRARAIVAVARGSFEAAQAAIERKAEEERLSRQRREQLSLDEAVQGRRSRARTHER